MKAFIVTLLFVGAALAEVEVEKTEDANVKEAQFPMGGMNPMMMNPMMMNPMMMGGMMRPQAHQNYGPNGYPVDYSMGCSRSSSCGCAQVCVQWQPCQCACPPPCPPQTTTVIPPVENVPVCVNGAPDFTYPDCCFNGGRGEFCCQNGANNLHCCTNQFRNPWCGPVPTPSPPVSLPPGQDDCNQCSCQPCIPWTPCPPCPCQQRCGGWGRK